MDSRITTLAEIIINYSLEVKPGEKVFIQNMNCTPSFLKALIRTVYAAGGLPFVKIEDKAVERELLLGATEEQLTIRAEHEASLLRQMDCFIGFTAQQNLEAWKDVPQEKMALYNKTIIQKVTMETRLPYTRWVVLRYPTPAAAQLAEMSEDAFEDFFFKVCTLDYRKMSLAMDSLVNLMKRTDKVRITAPGTDITFSIKGMPVIKCDGKMNIPDGEVYTAPLKTTVNGMISYNTPSLQNGFVYNNIHFTFKNGKIIDATANDSEKINHTLDIDEGARYIGEFSLGINPYILSPMKETLFDEKIAGSLHFTPGNSYDDCDNGNKSSLHWDLVLIQRPEYGGGCIYFDDILIRKDGRFVISDLEHLNPENLV